MKDKQSSKVKKFGTNRRFMSNSIQYQILVPIILLIVLAVGAVAFVSYQASVDNTSDELTENVQGQMNNMNDTFELFFSNIDNTLNRFSTNALLVKYQSKNKKELAQYFKETQETSSIIANIYTVFDATAEAVIYPPSEVVENDTSSKERVWYQEAVKAGGEVIWTESYTDDSTGEIVVTAAKAYYDGDKLIGVVASDVYVTALIDIINKVKIGDTGYAVVFDHSGKVLAHPDESFIGKDQSQEDFYKKMIEAGEQGIIEYDFEGEEKIIGFTKNPTTGWLIGGTVFLDEFKEKARSIIGPISITLGIVLLLAIIISLYVTRRMANRIKVVMNRMNEVANGDLSKEPLQANSNDEISQLVIATNTMTENNQRLLSRIAEVSEEVSSQSEELTQSASEVKTGTEQIATTMEELASGSETQANSAGDLASIMGVFAMKVDEANEEGENIQENSRKVLDKTNEGSQLMQSSTEQMKKINHIVNDAVEKMLELDNQSKEISQLVLVIKDIADQTNLLALNAAIEAARAGENGKGFAVVADEVRKLAEQVAHSVSDITGIVTNIQKESNAVAESLKGGYTEVEQGTKQIETTGITFNEISAAVTEMVQNINTVSENLSEIAANSQEMNGAVENIASVTEEAAAGVEETAASAQQASSSMEEVAGSSEHLAKLAEELNELVGQYKL